MKPIFPILICFLQLSIFSQFQSTSRSYVKDIRFNYFVLEIPPTLLPDLLNSTMRLTENGKVIGKFSVIRYSGAISLCKLISGSPLALNVNSYFEYQNTFPYSESKRKPALKSEPPVPTAREQSQIPSEVSVAGIQYKRIENFYLSKTPIPYSKFGSLDELNGYLRNLKTSSKYIASIPSESLIREKSSDFQNVVGDLFCLCRLNDTIGYFYFKLGNPIFESISPATLLKHSTDFFIAIILKEE